MIRVLVVDDDALALELHTAYVGRIDGFEVVGQAPGARAALTALAERAIDLVLLDMTMPDGDGLEAYRAYAEGLDRATGTTTQAEVDALLGTLRPAAAPALPKGLSDETLAAVSERVRAASAPPSSTEVAEAEGMSRVTARRYLEHLAETGRVRREPRYGGPGRPEITYAWTRV